MQNATTALSVPARNVDSLLRGLVDIAKAVLATPIVLFVRENWRRAEMQQS